MTSLENSRELVTRILAIIRFREGVDIDFRFSYNRIWDSSSIVGKSRWMRHWQSKPSQSFMLIALFPPIQLRAVIHARDCVWKIGSWDRREKFVFSEEYEIYTKNANTARGVTLYVYAYCNLLFKYIVNCIVCCYNYEFTLSLYTVINLSRINLIAF